MKHFSARFIFSLFTAEIGRWNKGSIDDDWIRNEKNSESN